MYKEGIHFMDYRTILQEENDAVRERLDLSMERVAAMGEEDIRQPYGNYFRCVSRFILMIGELVKEREEGKKQSGGLDINGKSKEKREKNFLCLSYRSEITDFMKIFCLSTMR